ncbi:hypothetical protein FGM00_04125 [Aggregatimonas sangjinii]|uniref:Uncharacterized protein n=1 Tax=Aggregatimonas sangjinii TaxID=2583587 RepID=A0A5B7SQU4_9FLAO|nr:hypothetical protein [Aggregatimonas sangjinii]QCW99337.1 hypothetical protein FGM00_04125 [Aggregatimonas sangjinii]
MNNMYTGKSSRNPNMPLIWGVVIGLGLIAFGIYLYTDLAAWENSDEEMRMNSLLWLLYDTGGKIAVTGFFALIGVVAVFSGYKQTNTLRKLKKEAGKNF